MHRTSESGTSRAADGCAIAYTLHYGPGPGSPRVVLIHSLALDSSIWDGVVTQLAPHASVLVYDCRGHGRSERRLGPYTPELFAQDLAVLLDHVAWPSAVLAGCSMGGCVAQAFTGLFASRVVGLCLIDTTAWYGPDAPSAWRERAAVARGTGLAGLIDFQITRWFGDRFRAEQQVKVEAAKRVFLETDLECFVATCEMLGDADLRHYLPSFKIPVAVVVGEEDYATPIAAAQQLQHAISDATLTILPKARHITPIEAPDRIASELLTVLDRCRTEHAESVPHMIKGQVRPATSI